MMTRLISAGVIAAAMAASPIAVRPGVVQTFPSTSLGTGRSAVSVHQATVPATAATFDVQEKTIAELQAALASGAVTSRSLVLAYLARIRAYDLQGPRLNAMIAMNRKVLEIADALDKERAAGRLRGPLHGIPIVVKDNFETIDQPTTGGSLALTGFMTGRDAFQVKKLRDAGAIIVG
jgi:hypothetical protein